jgi:hypothetical protein
MLLAVLQDPKTYDAVGRCIYCGRADLPLTREHIIPSTLDGGAILPESSCDPCREEVGRYERFCLNQTFIQARTFLKLPMAEPQRRFKDLRLGAFESDEVVPARMPENFRWEDVPVEDHPALIAVPVFAAPAILLGIEPSNSFDGARIGMSTFLLNGPPPALLQTGERTLPLVKVDDEALARFVAKIAHGAACAELRPENFRPFLQDLIRNRDELLTRYIGSAPLRKWPLRKDLHHVELYLRGDLIIAQVQLFSRYGINPFVAVVGTR